MIERIVPPGVAAVDLVGGPPADVLVADDFALGRAVEERRREYASVRFCARRAMRQLGVPVGPLLPGVDGAPQWPPGIVGSMTHCTGYHAAALARATDVAAIGIDAEPNAALPVRVRAAVFTAVERSWLCTLARAAPDIHWDRLCFSAKEALFKAWFPLTGHKLPFEASAIRVRRAGSFVAFLRMEDRVVMGHRIDRLDGRWLVSQGFAVTAIVVPASLLEPGTDQRA